VTLCHSKGGFFPVALTRISAGLIANAADGMAVFGTVAQALVPAAPGLFPALGL